MKLQKILLKHTDERMQTIKILKKMKNSMPQLFDRLVLDKLRVESISNGLIEISKLNDPVGKIIDSWTRPNGLEIQKVSIPLGVIGVIYESRPNVAADAAGLCV